jgi:hypothetical protein
VTTIHKVGQEEVRPKRDASMRQMELVTHLAATLHGMDRRNSYMCMGAAKPTHRHVEDILQVVDLIFDFGA